MGPLARNSGKEQGTIFISQTGEVFKSPKITVEKIKEMLQNPYIKTQLRRRSLTHFPDRVLIEALDPTQNVDEEVTHRLQNMCELEDVRLNEKIKQADSDSHNYGEAHYNPIWVRKGSEITLQKLRHLPAWSFDTCPISENIGLTWSALLSGVILGENGPEYWQRQNDIQLQPIQITNILIVKDPQSEGLAGDSELLPLCQIVEMIKYGWNTEMQVIHRSGAPIFFIKITNPRPAEDPACDGVSDIAYANMVIKKASKNTQFILRDNMEIVNVPLDPKKDVLQTIDVLNAVIEDYFSISKMLSKGGALIGGSNISELKLLNQAIRGLHNWLLAPFEDLLNQYFTLNNFPEGWTVRLTIPVWDEDKTASDQKDAELGISGQCVDLDDLRQKLHYEPADDAKKASIEAFWASKVPAPVASATLAQVPDEAKPAQFSKPAIHMHEGDDIQDPIADEMASKLSQALDKLSEEILGAYPA